jgi:hypothetical protein
MSEAKFTPGPWVAVIYDTIAEAQEDGCFRWAHKEIFPGPVGGVYQGDENGFTGLPGSIEVSAADAHLIAAAPDLLAACEEFARWFDGWCPDARCCALSGLPIHERTMAAIKKAKGGMP